MNTDYIHNKDELLEHIKDGIAEIKEYKPDNWREDLHFHLFNEDYYIIGTYRAEQWLGDKVFHAIETIREYEQDNFGEVNTDFSDPEKVVNMYAYIAGEYLMQEMDLI